MRDMLENLDLLGQQDPTRALARLMGVRRLAALSRARLDEAITQAQTMQSGAEFS